MKKLFGGIGIIFLLVATFVFSPTTALTQSDIVCDQDVIVQADDTLSKLADQFYGDVLAFPAIVEATNAQAADEGYARIDDPGLLEVGWKLCVPSAEDAQAILDELGPTAVAPATTGGDRVGFPAGYKENFQVLYEFDRPDNKTARVIYGNAQAASVTADQFDAASVAPGAPFPYGSIIVMEVFPTQKDENENVLLDENGRFIRNEEPFGLFVMRKEQGYGTLYGEQRNGEWEYAAYRPDGTVFVATENSFACAACHVEASQGKDWVFGIERIFGQQPPQAGENEISISDYTFQPETLTVQVGTEVKWTNNDVVFHTVTANDLSFNSGGLRPNASFSHTFEEPGVFEFFSAFQPGVKAGRIEVVN